MTGKILREKRGLYSVFAGGEAFSCHAGSRIRKEGIRLQAGDEVRFEDNGDGSGYIVEVTPRRNSLVRPPVSNVDALIIVASVSAPEPYLFNIDKLALTGAICGAQVVIAVNKCDLQSAEELIGIYRRAGFRCFELCASDGRGTAELREFLRGKTSVFAGASGVGKSSLLNALYPEMNVETGDLSRKISRGRNTTRHTELFLADGDTYIADTPGFTMLDSEKIGICDPNALIDYFPEAEKYKGLCRYRGCTHLKEEGCAVIEAVKEGDIPESRHNSYVRLYEEIKSANQY